ncbi:hypothetical protein [Dyadobacter sp. 50-39]|nr:hypothetical protein [Dyadobacter sp. 50-39]
MGHSFGGGTSIGLAYKPFTEEAGDSTGASCLQWRQLTVIRSRPLSQPAF